MATSPAQARLGLGTICLTTGEASPEVGRTEVEEPFLDLDDLLARIDAVTLDEVADVAATFCEPDRQLLLRLGPEHP